MSDFTLETSLSIDEVRQKLRQPIVVVRPLGQWYGEIGAKTPEQKLNITAIDDVTFRLNFEGCPAEIVLIDAGNKTLIKGQIKNPWWFYLNFLSPSAHITAQKYKNMLLDAIKIKLDAYPYTDPRKKKKKL